MDVFCEVIEVLCPRCLEASAVKIHAWPTKNPVLMVFGMRFIKRSQQ